jgi:hypothetical protein
MTRVLRTFIFAGLVAAGTVIAGWWTVPVLAAVWVRVIPRLRGAVRSCMLGAALAWGLLLGWTALEGPVGLLARRAGGVLGLPGWGLLVVTLLFPALLAGAAARVAQPAPHR